MENIIEKRIDISGVDGEKLEMYIDYMNQTFRENGSTFDGMSKDKLGRCKYITDLYYTILIKGLEQTLTEVANQKIYFDSLGLEEDDDVVNEIDNDIARRKLN